MKKWVIFGIISLFLWGFGSFGEYNFVCASMAQPIVVDDMQIGGIDLGQSSDDAINKIGQPIRRKNNEMTYNVSGGYDLWFDEGLFIVASKDDKMLAIFCTNSKYTTGRGVRVGDTLRDIYDNYGDPPDTFKTAGGIRSYPNARVCGGKLYIEYRLYEPYGNSLTFIVNMATSLIEEISCEYID